MIFVFELYMKKKMFKIGRYFQVCEKEFRQQVWGLAIFPYCYLAVLKISK